MDNNLALIRQLMDDAFSPSEIDTLVFDYFHVLYGDVSGMLKSKKIETLVDYCNSNGLLPILGQEIAERNPRQFARYAQAWKQEH